LDEYHPTCIFLNVLDYFRLPVSLEFLVHHVLSEHECPLQVQFVAPRQSFVFAIAKPYWSYCWEFCK